ncbi:MAG TPA: glycosyl hydrolase family 65 protein, partial [Isosphaeraceae bacterium]|nr:glycosyl hydrolase family 65 protein [Isosphaeraceae bacterium]
MTLRRRSRLTARRHVRWAILLCALLPSFSASSADTPERPILNKQALLDAQTFWDNRDWDGYQHQIPFFECPDADINTTYYYRWELLTKHLTYGSPATGYNFTEFMDRPFWSGTYGAISCPLGHQLYEARWLRDPRIARDYCRYWLQTPGSQPRRYSCWLADSIWAVHKVHPDKRFATRLLAGLIRNYEGWERSNFVPEAGLFCQTGHDDGMETNINSRQTQDTLRGAPGYRPTLNSYLWADALAIAQIADLAGDAATARTFREKAAALKQKLQAKLWDPRREFFFPMARQDEERDGFLVKAGALTYQTGKFAGSPHGREEIGFAPWQFSLPDPGYESAWKFLMDRDGFFADFGPTTVERHDPMFQISRTCCVWSGQSWPYATTQTLKALANLLQSYKQDVVSKADYLRLLQVYSRTHRRGGQPYIAEAADPDTGSWDGHDSFNHSEHYFHSGFVDLIITGLVGLRPRADDVLEADPLAPDDWAYFALDDVSYHGRRVAIVWDRDGNRYGLGKGLHILADGKEIASAQRLERLTAELPPRSEPDSETSPPVNFAVNNDGLYYPRVTSSFTASQTPITKVNDGHSWYHVSPPNRWTCAGSPHDEDWCAIDLGVERKIDTVKLYVLDDGQRIRAPSRFDLEFWNGSAWVEIPRQTRAPNEPAGHRANVIRFPVLGTRKIRALFTHSPGAKTGLTEFEAWGDGSQPIEPALLPADNLAYNPGGQPFPKASASFTSRFDKVVLANDGRISYAPNPANRWTSF